MTAINWLDGPSSSLDRDGPGSAFAPFDLINGPERSLVHQVAERLRSDPSGTAIDDGSRRLSNAELLNEVAALAAAIIAQVPPGAPVGVRLPDCASAPVAWLASLAAGCPAVLLDAGDASSRFADIAATSRLAAVISDRPADGMNVIAPVGHPPAPLEPRDVEVGAPAFVVWTSGSTGRPKGIVQSQRSVLYRSGLLVNSGHLSRADRYLSLNVVASMGGLLNAVAALLSGACLHRVDLARDGLGGVLDRIERSRITAMIGVPALYRAVCRLGGAAGQLTSLRLISSNGDALLAADLELLRGVLPDGCDIQMIYGATETQAGMRFVPVGERPSGPQVPAGRPIPGVQFAILDDGGDPVRDGDSGELWIRSRYTAIGEWEDGACVPGRLRPEPVDGLRRYAMGDVVRIDADGAFVVVGRKDRQIKLDGYRVEPVEIEAALRAEPDVLDAVVLPVPDGAAWRLTGFVVATNPAPDGFAARLRKSLSARLPPAMRLQTIHLLDALPLLAGNKIDVAALRRVDSENRRR